jgi:energy-converting hydrogenase Eha subunit C
MEEEHEYRRILSTKDEGNIPPWKGVDEDEEMTWREVRSQVTVIFNILLSTLATSAAVWKVAGAWDTPARMAAAFASAIVVVIAEVVLFGGYVRRIDEARRRAEKDQERKKVVGVWEIGRDGIRLREEKE